MMTRKERVKRALTFDYPDRAPRDVWALPYVQLFRKDELDELRAEFPMDIGSPQLSPGWSDKVVQATRTPGYYRDDWGSVWYVGEAGVIGEVKEPALADWSALAHFQPPWHLVRGRYLSHANRCCALSDQFMLSDVTARPFERLQFLRGTQNLYCDIGYGVPELRVLLEMVHEFYLEDIRVIAVDPPDMSDPEILAPGDFAAVEPKGSIPRSPILDHEGRVEDG